MGIVLIVLIWTANLVYFETQQLSEPLVLNSYYELHLREIVTFDIYYLMNKGDDNRLIQVILPEGRSLRVDSDNTESTYTHHNLKRASVIMNKDDIEGLLDDGDYSFTDVELKFSNGEKVNTEIGEIIIHQGQEDDLDDSPLQFSSGGSSNNNMGFTILSVKKPVVIHSLNYQWQEELKDFLQIYINTSQETLAEIADVQRSNVSPDKLHTKLFSMEGEKPSSDLFPINLKLRYKCNRP